MTEDQLEQDALGWLAAVGWRTVRGVDIAPDGPAPGRGHYREVVLAGRLRAAIARLNPAIPQAARDDALQQVLDLGIASLPAANRHFHRLLVGGVPVDVRQPDGQTRGDRVRLADWADAATNDWLAVSQFTVKGPRHARRPDLVLFVNGLPLVVVELKSPADRNATIWKAHEQLQTYQSQIPDLFQFNELLVIADGSEALMGSITSDAERFMGWRTIDGVALDPLGPFQELQTLVRGVLDPARLLAYLRHFVLFEEDGEAGAGIVKKIAGYHQFHAVLAAVEQVLRASRPGGTRKGGVVWHTQGSGKSITMTCFAARVMQEPALANPTIVVVTDRNDLDGQLFGVFSLARDLLRETPVQAATRQALRALLANRPSGGIVFTTIQKFIVGEDEDAHPLLSDRRNVVVVADEAHRTQYGFEAKLKTVGPPRARPAAVAGGDGRAVASIAEFAPPAYAGARWQAGYAQHLRDALPNATFVAFTGTPVSGEDRDTRAVFGDYIHVYDMQQAREDGATVAIWYESRLAKIGLKEELLPLLDDEVDELAEDEEESVQARLKTRWAALEGVVGAQPRVQRVAEDLLRHFEARCALQPGKAMAVAMSREICVRLYDEIVRLRPHWHDADPEKGAMKIVMTGSASDKAALRPHVHAAAVKKRLETRFKDPADELRLVIVRDMWLTGFDAPCVHTLYVDKPMRGHALMQAIARVNRVFRGKEGGLVVDYVGIGHELRAAMKEYAASDGRGRPSVDVHEALAVVLEKLDVLRALLHGYDWSGFLAGGHRVLAGAANHVLGLASDDGRDGRRRFADAALAMEKAFRLCGTLDEAAAVRAEVGFMQAVKVVLTKKESTARQRSDQQRDLAVRRLIDRAVVSDSVVDVFDAVGLDKPDIGLLDDAFLAQVASLPERNLAVDLLARLLQGEIRSRFGGHVVQQRRFSEMLGSVVTRYQNRSIETAQVIEELVAMARAFQEAASRGERLGLAEDELRFYDALATNESAVRELGDATLRAIAHELTASLRASLTVDWSRRDSVRARLRLMVRRLLRKYRYPPDAADSAVDLVLRQAEEMAEEG